LDWKEDKHCAFQCEAIGFQHRSLRDMPLQFYMYEQIDESTFIFASRHEYEFLAVNVEQMEQILVKQNRMQYIPKLLEQLKEALKRNEIALKEAEEGELADVGAIYLERKRIKKEIDSISNEFERLPMEVKEGETLQLHPITVHPKIKLKLGYNVVHGQVVQLLKNAELHHATIFN
jgi:hypothetical protein